MTRIAGIRQVAVLALGVAALALPAPVASARPAPEPTPTPINRQFCPLQRIGTQLVRCDNLTGAGVPAASWITEQRWAG